ncbi:MAG TPA: bifunctional phosphopantothenoylcysteine decarboxylase/phosphopantothenate--cysteine ligase CoaBC [Actinomycetota bacterium]|nr:bifunctional phosphopantothenoylcysteine decarboxylase/phosphopantothenate--cysteine ligase CoaBC [Actinomycetota bacterium]
MSGRRIAVAVCGSIAAYKMVDVVRRLQDAGAEVKVLMTPSATRFVGSATFAAVTGSPVVTDLFEAPDRVVHVELARWADLILVGAATASTLHLMAAGGASDAVSATYLMCRCPVVVAPAMHTEMWEHEAVRRNVARLVADGVAFAGPVTGALASGDHGIGRLAETGEIVDLVRSSVGPRDLDGVKLLVTAGPTREPVDPVRFVSNRSSGRMGFEIAGAAAARGADVTVVCGPVSVPTPAGVDVVRVETAQQMLDECLARFDDCDVVVKAAAVADWRPTEPSQTKRPKSDLGSSIGMEPTPDIAAELGRKKGRQILVAFAAQTGSLPQAAASASEKLSRKNADLVVANVVGSPDTGFESDTNDAALVSSAGVRELPRMPKRALAGVILDEVVRQLRDRP